MTRKPHLTPEEKLAFATRVKKAIDNGATLWVSVPHTSRSNMTYTVNARLLGGSLDSDLWLNYWLGAELGGMLDASDNLKRHGCGTDRAFQVAHEINWLIFRHGLGDFNAGNDIKRAWF
jgi:hypothetical protein